MKKNSAEDSKYNPTSNTRVYSSIESTMPVAASFPTTHALAAIELSWV